MSKPCGKAKDAIRYLTVKEQLIFTEAIKGKANEPQFQIALQTGLRAGEIMGLTWDCIDFKNRKILVEKQIEFRYKQEKWRAAPPKSLTSFRTVPMTSQVYDIFGKLYLKKDDRRLAPVMEESLEYHDPRTDEIKSFIMKDLVFVSSRSGEPIKHSSYDTCIYKICESAGLDKFSMHSLRHTFATRCIERGVPVKALQRILGHANIMTTLDTYVHASDDFLVEAMKIFEA